MCFPVCVVCTDLIMTDTFRFNIYLWRLYVCIGTRWVVQGCEARGSCGAGVQTTWSRQWWHAGAGSVARTLAQSSCVWRASVYWSSSLCTKTASMTPASHCQGYSSDNRSLTFAKHGLMHVHKVSLLTGFSLRRHPLNKQYRESGKCRPWLAGANCSSSNALRPVFPERGT